MAIEIGAVLSGKYRLERQLASGGMGSVWLAARLADGARVAIKVLDLEAAAETPDALMRFEREARAVSRLSHPNIVQVLDFGFDAVTPFFVMELLSGESLEDRLRRRKRLPLHEVRVLLRQIEGGLSRAHEARVIHRDLKPGNLFLAATPAGEIVKILDFGIAKHTDVQIDHSTKTGEFMGSPHYMSPEQIRDSKGIDTRSDLWSLGIVLFRALTGMLPFPGTTLGAVLADVLSGVVPKPSELAADLSPEVDAFFEKALARDRNQRFATAKEMAGAFDALFAPEEAGPPEPPVDSQERPTMDAPAPPPPLAAAGSEREERSPDSKTTLWASNSGVMQAPRAAEPAPPDIHSSVQAVNTSGMQARPSQPAQPSYAHPPFPQPSPSGHGVPAPPPSPPGWSDVSARLPPPPVPSQPGQMPDWSSQSKRLQIPVPQAPPSPPHLSWAAKGAISIGLSVMAALLLVVILRGGGESPAKPAPAGESSNSAGLSPSASSMAGASQVPSAPEAAASVVESAGSDVEGVIQMQEGSDVEQAIEADPGLLEQADAGVAAKYKMPPIPYGKGRLIITSKIGPCKLAVNGQPAGSAPVHVFVAPGKVRVYCRLQTGSTKMLEQTVPKGRTTFMVFNKK